MGDNSDRFLVSKYHNRFDPYAISQFHQLVTDHRLDCLKSTTTKPSSHLSVYKESFVESALQNQLFGIVSASDVPCNTCDRSEDSCCSYVCEFEARGCECDRETEADGWRCTPSATSFAEKAIDLVVGCTTMVMLVGMIFRSTVY